MYVFTCIYAVIGLMDHLLARNKKVLTERSIAGYSRRRFISSHRKLEDGFSTGAVYTVDKLFEGIRSVTTRIYKGLVIIEKGCANRTRLFG